jgi:peroxiredoxin
MISTQMRLHKGGWKVGLWSLGLGLGILVGILAFLVLVTNDMRWILWLGSAALLGSAVWVAGRGGGLFSIGLVCLPLVAVFGVEAVGELPGLWPHLVFWPLFALIGWYGFRPPRRHLPAALLAALVACAIALWYCSAYIPGALASDLNHFRDDPAPEFTLMNLDGTPYPMASLDGKVVILDFFATWCAPCIAELPELEGVRRDLSNRRDVEVLIVANDSGDDTPESIRAFTEENPMEVPFVYDPDGKAHAAFGFAGLPGLVVMDRSRRIRLTREGYNAAEIHFRENLVSFVEGL